MLSCEVLIERIRLGNYRNLESVDLRPPSGINLIFGQNAQGKTNFLDALHLATYLKSARAARERDVVQDGKSRARVEVELKRKDGRKNRLIVTSTRGKKFVKLDGNAITRFEDAIGVLSAHFFFPDDLTLIKGDPAVRREALDYEILKAVPSAIRVFHDYNRALKARNALLKRQAEKGGSLRAEMKPWQERMIASGVEIVRMRMSLVDRILPKFVTHYKKISENEEPVRISYHSSTTPRGRGPQGKGREEMRAEFEKRLREAAGREAELGYTTVGPHRDELLFEAGKRTLRQYGSQGEQRSAVLAFKIALCDVARELSNEDPVLCLDDALSELDDERKENLLNTIDGRTQVFLTLASEKELGLVGRRAAAVWRVSNGKFS